MSRGAIFCLLSALLVGVGEVFAFRLVAFRYRQWTRPGCTGLTAEEKGQGRLESIKKAMDNARKSSMGGVSPGAQCLSADEQSDAAYADLINTSMDQRGIDNLSEEELELLEQGGRMWEDGSKEKKNKNGALGDIFNALKALSGGAHIEKNEYGET